MPRVDIILTDVNAPGINGITVSERPRPLFPLPQVAFMSSQARTAAARCFIAKPLINETLMGILADALPVSSQGEGWQRIAGQHLVLSKPLPLFKRAAAGYG
jgi:CheY-like chemotaxis protein